MGWKLPVLFWETKAVTGRRLADVCSLRLAELRDGRVTFLAADTKARKDRISVLPPDLFTELVAFAGPTHIWESYVTDMPEYLERRGVPSHRLLPGSSPNRVEWWAMDEVDDFNKAHPDKPELRTHDFRKRAITKAHRAGLDVDTVATGMGVTAAVIRNHYLAQDQAKAAAMPSATLGDTLRRPRPSADTA